MKQKKQSSFIIAVLLEYALYTMCFLLLEGSSIENALKAAAVLVGFTRVFLPIIRLEAKK
jgi:hypothetical protein